jgi:hypothetical protein
MPSRPVRRCRQRQAPAYRIHWQSPLEQQALPVDRILHTLPIATEPKVHTPSLNHGPTRRSAHRSVERSSFGMPKRCFGHRLRRSALRSNNPSVPGRQPTPFPLSRSSPLECPASASLSRLFNPADKPLFPLEQSRDLPKGSRNRRQQDTAWNEDFVRYFWRPEL